MVFDDIFNEDDNSLELDICIDNTSKRFEEWYSVFDKVSKREQFGNSIFHNVEKIESKPKIKLLCGWTDIYFPISMLQETPCFIESVELDKKFVEDLIGDGLYTSSMDIILHSPIVYNNESYEKYYLTSKDLDLLKRIEFNPGIKDVYFACDVENEKVMTDFIDYVLNNLKAKLIIYHNSKIINSTLPFRNITCFLEGCNLLDKVDVKFKEFSPCIDYYSFQNTTNN